MRGPRTRPGSGSGRRISTTSRLRARVLLDGHLRVGEAGRAAERASVQALPRLDVIGVYVLLPKVD